MKTGMRSACDSLEPRIRADIGRAVRLAVLGHRAMGWPDHALRAHLITQWGNDVDTAYSDPSVWARGELVFQACLDALDAALAAR